MELKNKVVVVTGSSRGIGRAIALKFAEKGALIVVNYNTSKKSAEEVLEKIKALGSGGIIVNADVSKEKDVLRLMKSVFEKFGRIDILVNNAGTDKLGIISEMDAKIWEKIVSTNLTSVFLCTKYAIPHLKKSDSPLIINVGSRLGFYPVEGCSAYSASKAGVINFTKASSIELAKYRIRVNAIVPFPTDTDLLRRIVPAIEFEKIKTNHMVGSSEEAADIALSIACDDNLNGEVISDKRLSKNLL